MVSTEEFILIATVAIEILGGVWLAGLTYIMWRDHNLRKKKAMKKELPDDSEEQSEPA